MLYRVTLNDNVTVMHMGDADPRAQHFLPYKEVWENRVTHMAFPPYWFTLVPGAHDFLTSVMNVKDIVGVHVPIILPNELRSSETDYFDEPGEMRTITGTETETPD